jgi:hypothetical protein
MAAARGTPDWTTLAEDATLPVRVDTVAMLTRLLGAGAPRADHRLCRLLLVRYETLLEPPGASAAASRSKGAMTGVKDDACAHRILRRPPRSTARSCRSGAHREGCPPPT